MIRIMGRLAAPLLAVALTMSACTDIGNFAEPTTRVVGGPQADCKLTVIGCPVDPPRTGNSGELVIDIGLTIAECTVGTDSDGDGLSDDCEFRVAAAFAPWMRVDKVDDISRDEHYVVMPGPGNQVMVFYAFAYHRDHGTTFGAWDHAGDSEFVIFQLIPRSTEWVLHKAFLSAHYNESRGESSEGLLGNHLERYSGVPLIWVENGKHANYKSKDACGDGGAAGWDSCRNNNKVVRFNVYTDGNLGQSENDNPGLGYRMLVNCTRSRSMPNVPRIECFWITEHRFYGWQPRRNDSGSTAYYDHMTDFGFHGARANDIVLGKR